MLARAQMVWVKVRDSLWFIPGIMTLAAGALAVTIVALERQDIFFSDDSRHWIFEGGAEGARGVLSAIAGSLITVTGVVFSVTIVALQLASSQFTPRVLRNFTADRSNQVVLGVFIATFTYTLLVLRTVHSETSASEAFIPRVAVTIAVVLVLVSIGFLIFFINHAARSIQVSAIIDRITRSTLGDVYRLFPEQVGDPDEADVRALEERWKPALVRTKASGYLQAVDANALFELGARKDVLIRMEPKVGAFLLAGEVLAVVRPAAALDEKAASHIRRAFVVGADRTPEQDVEYGIIEIADIAVKALSPGINDPTTAMRCIDRLGEILLALGTRNPPRARRTREGHVHFLACYTTFDEAVSLAYDQILHFGRDNAVVVIRLSNVLLRLEALVPAHRRGAVTAMRERVQDASRRLTDGHADVTRVSGADSA